MHIVLCGDHPYDEMDGLAADICASIKRRGEQFESDEQLTHWLTEDGVQFTPDSLSVAQRQLERLGWIKRPIVEYSWGLTEDGVQFTPDSLSVAQRQLERLGRIKRPIVEYSWANEPLPGTYIEPRVYSQ